MLDWPELQTAERLKVLKNNTLLSNVNDTLYK